MRVFRGLGYGLLLLAMGMALGSSGEALAACCMSTHVYVPPPHVVVVPHTTYIPHTTYVRPVTTGVHPHTTTTTVRTNTNLTIPQTAHARHTPHVQPVTVVTTQPTATKKRCEKGQSAAGCKKDEEQTTWSRIKGWLHSDK
jgi:hypothetical protein